MKSKTLCGCGHHALAHHAQYREEFGNLAGRFGIRGACNDCACRRYASDASRGTRDAAEYAAWLNAVECK